MAFYHRKLILDIINTTILPSCDFFCNPARKTISLCPTSCISVCSEICVPISALIPPPTPPPPIITSRKYHPNKTYTLSLILTISLAILAATFFIFCCYAIYKYYTDRYRSRRVIRSSSQAQTEETHDEFLDEDHGPVLDHPIWYIRTIGLQPSIINSITVCKYKRGDGLVEGTECSVCLSEFEEDETLRLLPKCNHAFHIPCIDTWLRSHTNCPMCRAGIVVSSLACSPSPEQNVENSGLGEETQEGISESNREFGREREDGDCELRIGIEEEGELQVENERIEVLQPIRRSVSVDSVSASMISLAVTNALPVQSDGNSDTQLVKVNESNLGFVPKRVDINQSLLKLVGSSSFGRSLQRGPISMKRSFSCSGKVLLSRYSRSRSRNSVLPS